MSQTPHTDPLLLPDTKTDHILGPVAGKVHVIEYGDFECPTCRQAYGAVKVVLREFAHQVCFIYRHYPQLSVHPHAELAAEAAEAAGAQGHFWPYYDMLFEHQDHLKEKDLRHYAEEVGVDLERYDYEMKDHVYLQRVQEHLAGGQRLGIRTTPAFYVNGELVDVSFGLQKIDQAIKQALAG